MSNLTASDTFKRKKLVPFVCGYELEGCSVFNGGIASTESVDHYFGQDSPTTENSVDNATLTITLKENVTNNVILNAVTWQDPDDTSVKKYVFDEILNTTAWGNRLNRAKTSYSQSVIYKQWLPTPGLTEGAPNEKGTRTFAGNAAEAQEFSVPIIGEKIAVTSGASGWTGTLTKAIPIIVPGTLLYALEVHAIEEARNGSALTSIEMDNLEVTAAMVKVDQTVTIPATALSKTSDPDYAYVVYLYPAVDGIAPTLTSDGQFEDMS